MNQPTPSAGTSPPHSLRNLGSLEARRSRVGNPKVAGMLWLFVVIHS